MEGTIATAGCSLTVTGIESGMRMGVEACQGRSNPLPEHLGGSTPGTGVQGRGDWSGWVRMGMRVAGRPVRGLHSDRVGQAGLSCRYAMGWISRQTGFVPDGNGGFGHSVGLHQPGKVDLRRGPWLMR